MLALKNKQLDLNQLSDKNNRINFAKKVVILHDLLSSDTTYTKNGITVNSTLLDIAHYYNSMGKLQDEYAKRKEIAPEWKAALKQWIKEIEDEELGNLLVHYHNGIMVYDTKEEMINPLMVKAFNSITIGKNDHLYTYAEDLVIPDEEICFNDVINSVGLQQIALGVALAYMLPRLKQELFENDQDNPILQNNNLRYNWIGTPAEHGAWIDLLIEKGYIEMIQTKKQKVKTSLDTFSIKTQKGEPVTERYLNDCFGRDKYHFNPKDIKVPYSLNNGKNK